MDAERHPEAAHDRRPGGRRPLPERGRHPLAQGSLPFRRHAVHVLEVVVTGKVGVGRRVDHAVGQQPVIDAERLDELRRVAAVAAGKQEHPAAVAGLIAVEHRRLRRAEEVDQPPPLGGAGAPHPLAQGVVSGIGALAVARRRVTHAQQEGAHRRQRGAGQRHLDHLAAAAVLARVERQGHRQRAMDRAVGGRQRNRRVEWRRLQLAADRVQVGEQPGGRAEDAFEGAQRGALLAGPEPRQGEVHQPRVGGHHGGGAKSQALHHPRAEVLDHHVRRPHQLQRGAAPGSALQIQLQRLLAAVEHGAGRRRAVRLAGARHLDHLGALIGQQHPGQRSGKVVAEVDNPNPCQRRQLRSRSRHGAMVPKPAVSTIVTRSSTSRSMSGCPQRYRRCQRGTTYWTCPFSSSRKSVCWACIGADGSRARRDGP